MSDMEQIPQNEEDVDSLLASLEQPRDESAIEPGAKPQADAQTTAQEAATKQAIQEYIIKVGGKEIKAPIEKLQRWAEQGYDAPNKIGELNKKLEAYSKQEAQFKEWQDRFGPVDQYVKQNPQWWQFVQSQYQQQLQTNPNAQLNPVIDKLQKQVEELAQYKTQVEERRQQVQIQHEDTQYMTELQNVQKQYPKVDLNTPDQSGKSLEYRVLEYAKENGIKKFTTAFRDYYHDELQKISEEQAKEKVLSDKQSKTKLGILGISPTPTRKSSDSVKGKSYGDLEREILEEYGINR